MGRRRTTRETIDQQLFQWKENDVLEGLTDTEQQLLLVAVAELLLNATKHGKVEGEAADE